MADRARAIAMMYTYRQTHIDWAIHQEGCDWCQENPPAYVDGPDEQWLIAAEYDNVLEILEGIDDDQ